MSSEHLASDRGFQVGDVAVIIGGMYPEYIGREVTILSPLQPDPVSPGHMAYKIDLTMPNIYAVWAWPELLRKKYPPREDWKLVSWDKCLWQPEKLHV